MWEIVGHARAVEVLRRAVERETLPHALLFAGPTGVGKTTLALELAKAVNCTDGAVPCQTCTQCHQIRVGSHPDVALIEAAEGRDSIAIQQVREIRESAALRPFQGAKKVFVIAGAEALTLQAADALLKTLEEPNPQVMLVLTAIEADSLPETILSRCRLLTLPAVESSVIARALTEQGQEQGVADRIAGLSHGSVGWAMKAAKDRSMMDRQEAIIDELSRMLSMRTNERLQLAEALAGKRDRSAIRRTLETLLLLGRDMLLLSQGQPPRLVSGEQQISLAHHVQALTLAQIHIYLRQVRSAMERVDQNVDGRLALEALMLPLPTTA